MTLGMRIRLWARQAPRSDVVTTFVVAIAFVVGLGLSALPPAGDKASSSGATRLDLSKAPSASGLDGTPAAAPTAGPEGSAPGSSIPATRADGGVAAGTSGTSATAAKVARKASDVGVTADQVKVGFVIAQLGGLDATGFAVGFRTDQAEAINAFVDVANKEGGANGRKIVPIAVKSDPLSASSMRAACIQLTDDDKVFSVVDTAATIGTSLQCYVDKRTPHVDSAGITVNERFLKRAGGYLVSTNATATRDLYNWTAFNLAAGYVVPGKDKLGILSDDCAPDPETIDTEFKPLLKEKGIGYVDVRVSCDPGTAQQQAGPAALQMRQNGVTRVVFTTIFTTSQTFINAAEAQAWRPKYSATDMWGNTLDFGAQNFNPDAFDGSRSFTYSFSGSDKAGHPLSPGVQRCDKILRDHGLEGVTDQMGRDAEVLSICDNFSIWLRGMRLAPVNPTRADWVAATQHMGAFPDPATIANVTYQPGKFSGGDSYAEIEWRKSCKCWVQVAAHRPAVY